MEKERCKKSVWADTRFPRSNQCSRKPWKDGYCKQHHPDTVAERLRKSDEKYDEKRKKSAWYLLGQARDRITELESQLANSVPFDVLQKVCLCKTTLSNCNHPKIRFPNFMQTACAKPNCTLTGKETT